VNYFPADTAPKATAAEFRNSTYDVSGVVDSKPIEKTSNFEQAGIFYRSRSAQDKADLVKNLAADLGQVTSAQVKTRMVSYFYQADKDYGTRVAKAVNLPLGEVTKAAAEYRAAYPDQFGAK
jgi:catalase